METIVAEMKPFVWHWLPRWNLFILKVSYEGEDRFFALSHVSRHGKDDMELHLPHSRLNVNSGNEVHTINGHEMRSVKASIRKMFRLFPRSVEELFEDIFR